ncbi:MAG TPA: signal peptidase I [Elusimicrobia bacterium]|nr:signal peptidase I [Elusimicrobiota bacterium]HBT61866.1 signal peptidase I [Elusimicrobiota bacterium]
MSLDSRAKFISIAAHAVSTAELYPSLAAALIAGAIGFWRGYSRGADPAQRRYYLTEDLEWAETVFSAVLLAAVLMYFVVQAFKIPSGSMRSTLLEGDHLFVNKFIYGLRVPFAGKRILAMRSVQRGDVIVFRFPADDPRDLHCGSIQYGKDFIKRVIGVPGDTVQVSAGRVFVNGQELRDEPYAQYLDGAARQPESVKARQLSVPRYQELWQGHALDRELEEIQRDYFGPVRVPERSYFVMGDNRDRSCDSRYWGPVEGKYLKGRAWFIYWPPSRMKTVR